MAANDDVLTVPKKLYDLLCQHCEACSTSSPQLREFLAKRSLDQSQQMAKITRASKKRKNLHASDAQELSLLNSQQSRPQEPRPQQPRSQQTRSQQSRPQQPESQQPESQQPESQLFKPLQFKPFRAQSQQTTHISQQPKAIEKSRKTEALDWFLRRAPKAVEWRKGQIELGLITVKQYEKVVEAFTSCPVATLKRQSPQGNERSDEELVEVAKNFASLTSHSFTNAILQTSFARFQALILLSYCEVLSQKGIPYRTIDQIINIGCRRERDRRALLKSAQWVNGIIVALVSHGWTIYRATELFFINALSSFYLDRISSNENSVLVLQHFNTDEFVKHDYSDCLRPEYTIPGLIASLLKSCSITTNKLSIDDICIALGYDTSCVPTSDESISNVYAASKSTLITPVHPNFEVSIPNSFQSKIGNQTSRELSSKTQQQSSYTFGSSRDSSSISLLLLLYSLGCIKIPEYILFRGLLPQNRWNDKGQLCEITLLDTDLNQQYAQLFSIRTELEQAIKSCIQDDKIIADKLEDDSSAYSLAPNVQAEISHQLKPEELILPGLIFIAYIYPREEISHESTHNFGKLLFPYLERFWEYVLGEKRLSLPAQARESLIEAFLAASKLAGVCRTNDAVAMIAKMREADLPDYLLLAAANRQSVLLRAKGDHDQSDDLILNILNRIVARDIRSHCLHGRLLLSRAENAILRKEFNKAISYVEQWECKNNPAFGYELQVIRLKNTVLGRMLRYQGNFARAKECLDAILMTIPTEASRYHVMHHLADVYCELKLATKAEELLREDIEKLKICGKHRSKAFRRLLLPFADAYIEQHKYEEATAVLVQLSDIFNTIFGHNVSDQLDHVRSVLALLRIAYNESRWSEALGYSEQALGLVQKYKTFSDGNFYIGVIYLFRTIIYFELGQLLHSQEAFALAKVCDPGPRHFIPGMGTYVLRSLWSRIGSMSFDEN